MSSLLNETSKPHILIIDDKLEDISTLLALLKNQQWKITLANNGHIGYQRALALSPDLILLDVVMPKINGFAVCRMLRETASIRHIPIIFLTNSGLPEERLQGFHLGGVDYVIKPFLAEEMLARINIHLQLSNHMRSTGNLELPHTDETFPSDYTHEKIIIKSAMKFIENNLESIPSLAVIARSAGTHEKKLSAIFRNNLGITVFGYVRRARLEKAQRLLTTTEISISEIARTTGFLESCNFITAFRKEFGCTPREYRKNNDILNNTNI